MKTAVAERVERSLGRGVAEAWARYLRACRYHDHPDYEALEAWAWQRLQSELGYFARGGDA